jgi:O-antigen/teichoic acid export membrane protein
VGFSTASLNTFPPKGVGLLPYLIQMKATKGKLFTNTMYYVTMSFIRNGMSFLTLPILTSFLTPNDYGIIGLITIITGFGTIFFGGVNSACSRYYFKYNDTISGLSPFFSTNLHFILCSAILYSLLLFLSFPYLNEFFFNGSIRFIWVGLGFLQFTLSYLNNINQNIFQNRHEGRRWFINEVVATGVYIGLSVLLVVTRLFRFEALIIAGLVSEVVRAIITFSLLREIYCAHFRASMLKESLVYSWPQVPSHLIGFGYSYLDRIIVSRISGMFQVGILEMTGRVSLGFKMILEGVGGVFSPVTVELLKSDTEEAYKRFADIGLKVLAFMLTLALGIILFSREMVLVLLRGGFRDVLYLIPLYIYGQVFGALGMISYWLIYYHPGKTWLQIPINVTGLISGTVANLLLIPKFGLMGAAMAMFLSSAIVHITQFYIGLRCTPIPFNMKKISFLFGAIIAETGLLYLLYFFKLQWSTEFLVKFVMLAAFVLGVFVLKIVLIKDIVDIWIYLIGRVKSMR